MSGAIIDSAQLRRGTLFLVSMGVPVIVGVLRHQPGGALIGAVAGMLLAFADNDGELFSRLRLLAINAGAMTGGAVFGYLCRGSGPALWSVFVAITLSVGMAARSGREALLTARNGAIAFTVAAEVPTFNSDQIWYPVGVIALTAASRVIDQLLAGPLPLQRGVPSQMPSGRGGWLRFALAFAGAAVASMWIGNRPDRVHAIWIVTTTIVVMLPDAQASYRRIFGRFSGTIAGVVVAWVITSVFNSAALICIAILLVAPLIPHHHAHRYWLHTALIALMVMLAYDLTLLNSPDMTKVLTQRLEDILVGCMIALVGTVVAFPHEVIAALNNLIKHGHKRR